MNSSTTLVGSIVRLKRDKGFGFIRDADSAQEYFFHADDLVGLDFASLQEQDKVYFQAGKGREGKGPRALNIQDATVSDGASA